MKTKITKLFVVLSVIAITMMMWTHRTQAQVAHFCLDTLVENKVKYCVADYPDGVWLYKKTGETNPRWEIQYPIAQIIDSDSILLSSVNNGGIWYTVQGNPIIAFKFYHLNPPTSPNLQDISICGTIWSFVLDAGNANTDASYLWSTGATTQSITATQAGSYWVHIDNGCGTIADTIQITVDHSNNATLGADKIICLGDTVALTTGNNNIVDYLWSTGATTPNIDVFVSGIYSVTTTDSNGCISGDSMELTVLHPSLVEILMITIETDPANPLYGNNKVTWETDLGNVQTIAIYREFTSNDFQLVATAPYLDSEWTDTISSKLRPWKYKIAAIDTCGNESTLSPWHETSKVSVNFTVGGFTANWTEYKIGGQKNISKYEIYTGDVLNNLSYVDYVPGGVNVYGPFNFTDSLVVIGAVLYGNKSNTTALSHPIREIDALGIDKHSTSFDFTLFPNPAQDWIEIQGKDILLMTIFDIQGNMVLISDQIKIDISSLSSGSYLVQIINESGFSGYSKLMVY